MNKPTAFICTLSLFPLNGTPENPHTQQHPNKIGENVEGRGNTPGHVELVIFIGGGEHKTEHNA
jgi:hypothetical protein